MSLPTVVRLPRGTSSGVESDVDFELDKRITERVGVQINSGYSVVSRPGASSLTGWQNLAATLKGIVLDDGAAERLVSLSLTREFGGTGAARVGAGGPDSTTPAVNFGQGFGGFAVGSLVKPFAVTGSAGYVVPDRMVAQGRDPQLLLLDASLQYSLGLLPGDRMPDFVGRLIPLVEFTYTLPTTTSGAAARRGTLAPGLIHAGDGYQLAAEALVPLTRATGVHAGFVVQLNLSLGWLGWAALARPLF
jgi:hypothetical protein